MDTGALKKFAQAARRQLLEEVAVRLEQVLQTDSIEIREKEKALKELQDQINKSSKEAVIEQVAYTWFNRFCALRYMDVNHSTRIGIVSPQEGFTQPEILQEAKQGLIDNTFHVDRQKVFGLLNDTLPSSNPQQEAYRLLLVGVCNAYHAQMPFLFPKIDDYTELLMPDDLLSENSILQAIQKTLTSETCQDVEVIGWLYQFYISERKDEVIQSKKKIQPKDIPAATQLFTPHWIVRYLVENSLGRLWMLNHPDSRLIEQMDYYIKPEEPETDFLEISSPEEINICDPACGSGHMLTYAFDLLYSIYAEQGYDLAQIPCMILKNNLYGIEIDQRAGHLAAFALMMKAREKDRRFFSREIEPNICVLENITFTPQEIENYKKAIGPELLTQDLWFLLQQFEQAENFGSLIRPQVKNPRQIRERLHKLSAFNDLILYSINEKVEKVLRFAEYLSPRYHVVVANPPYMGGKKQSNGLKQYIKLNYSKAKADLFAAFTNRIEQITVQYGQVGLLTPYLWMFLSSFEKFRISFIKNNQINTLVQLEYNAFAPAAIPVCCFTFSRKSNQDYRGSYVRLSEFTGPENQPIRTLEAIRNENCRWRYSSNLERFRSVPGNPIAYWLSDETIQKFEKSKRVSDFAQAKQGLITGDNASFLRFWWEVELGNIGIEYNSCEDTQNGRHRWFPFQKGGEYRKWFGNNLFVVDWQNNGERIKKFFDSQGKLRSRPQNTEYYFKPGITWTSVTIADFNSRFSPIGFIYSEPGPILYTKDESLIFYLMGLLNSEAANYILQLFAPGMHYNQGHVSLVPVPTIPNYRDKVINNVRELIKISITDWNQLEYSIEFTGNSILYSQKETLQSAATSFKKKWDYDVSKTKELEDEINEIFIREFQLETEVKNGIKQADISLASNPYYRYGDSKSEGELETLLLADIMKEFISYAVGCMLGRYSLDKEGLILANTGETLQDYLRQVPEPSFMPDEDNVIPVLEGEWFEDDIADRFKDFLKVTFGEENYAENLAFLEEAIGREIRSYFVKKFYNEHVKMYKQRPIYWLFSSPKGSFNALIYMHRYTVDTVSVILNKCLIPYRDKLTAHRALLETRVISVDASQGEKTRASREIDEINKVLLELKEYEDEILYPLATQRIEIDLDDGVLVNYNKFGYALKQVTGLSGN